MTIAIAPSARRRCEDCGLFSSYPRPTTGRLRFACPKKRRISSRLSAGRMRRASADASRASFGRSSSLQRPGRITIGAVKRAVAPRRRSSPARSASSMAAGPAERVGEDHAPECQPEILRARAHAVLHALDAVLDPADCEPARRRARHGPAHCSDRVRRRAAAARVRAACSPTSDKRAPGIAEHVRRIGSIRPRARLPPGIAFCGAAVIRRATGWRPNAFTSAK